MRSEKDPRIRMAWAIAVGKAKSDAARDAFMTLFTTEEDYRVKCNILTALGNFDYADVQAKVQMALQDPNAHVANRAAQYFYDFGIPQDAYFYWNTARNNPSLHVQLILYAAANKHLPAYRPHLLTMPAGLI